MKINSLFCNILLLSACYTLNNNCFSDDAQYTSKTVSKHHKHHHRDSKEKHINAMLLNNVWTLEAAIQLALQHYPEISGYIAAKRAAEKRIDGAKGGYLPTLDLRTAGGYEYTRDKIKGNKINDGVRGTIARGDHFEPSISLEQPLFDGFETVHQVKKAEREHQQAELKINEARVLIAYRVAEQYIALRRFQRLLKLAQENVTNHQQIAGKVETLVKAGKLTIVEREQVLSRLSDAESAVADIEGDVENAIANFVELVGEHPTALSKVNVPFKLLPTTLEQALQIAHKNNKSVILARATVDVAKSDMDVTKAAFYPKIGLNVDATSRHDVGAKDGTENNLTALIVFRWNLFNGGRDKARTDESKEHIIQAYHDMKKEQRSAEKEIRVSWGELKSSGRQAKALRQAVGAKQQLGNSYMAEFNVGKKSLLDILDARHEYFLAKGSLITADSTYDLAALRLLAAAGELPSLLKLDDNVEASYQPTAAPCDISQTELKTSTLSEPRQMPRSERNEPRSDSKVQVDPIDNLPTPRMMKSSMSMQAPEVSDDNYDFPEQEYRNW